MAITQLRNEQVLDATVEFGKLNTNAYSNDLSVSAAATELARADAIKNYVDTMVDTSLKTPEAYDPTGTGNYPLTYGGSGIEAGDSFRVTAVEVGIGDGTRDVNIEDLMIALVDGPSATVSTDWMVAESNRSQATETILGVSKIATQAIVNAEVNDTDYVTPLKMATYISANTLGAGAGLVVNGTDADVVAADLSLVVNADDMAVNIGTTNGTTLEVSATGLELAPIVIGQRTFNGGPFSVETGVNDLELNNGSAGQVNIGGATSSRIYSFAQNILFRESEISAAAITTAIPLAVTTTVDYGSGTAAGDLIDAFRAEFTDIALINAIMETKQIADNASVVKLTRYSNEAPAVTNGSAVLPALLNLGTHATDKVANVEVYLNGSAQQPGVGNDYTLNALTGVITMEFNLITTDKVLVHYNSQDA